MTHQIIHQYICSSSNSLFNFWFLFFYLLFADPSKRRRRFNPLRNLRRIFRRRTVGHADAIRHSQQQQHQHQHTGDPIRSLNGSQSVDDMPTCTTSGASATHTTLSAAGGGGGATAHHSNYIGARYSQTMLPLGSSKYRRNQAGHRPPIDVNDVDDDEDGVDDGGSDFQRSSSEGRLVDQ